jgi:hypothetical protein
MASAFVPPASGQGGGGGGDSAPVILFTDAVTGPTAFTHTGTNKGEGDLGCYLSVYGLNFGDPSGMGTTTKVFVGGVEVANYRYMGTTRVAAKFPWLQKIRVQLGALGNAPAGVALAVDVRVNGVSSSYSTLYPTPTFTPCAGKVHFASLSGDDNAAVPGDFAHPWRHLQISVNGVITGGMSPSFAKGDHCVIMGGDWSDANGQDTNWFRFRYPNIQEGDPAHYFHFTSYPGAIGANAIDDVHYTTPDGKSGGIAGSEGAQGGTVGDYVSVSDIRFDVSAGANSDAAPVNSQYSWYGWRCIDNEMGPWPSNLHSKGAGFEGHAQNSEIHANHIHDLNCVGAQETHGIYADSGAAAWNVSLNYVHDITGGNGVQFFDNNIDQAQPGWRGFEDMRVHHNWVENLRKYGLNFANSCTSGRVWNNVIIGAALSGIRFEISYPLAPYDWLIEFNTFYNNDTVGTGVLAQVFSDNANGTGSQTGLIKISDNIFCAGPDTVADSPYSLQGSAFFQFNRNDWYSPGHWTAGNTTKDGNALRVDPLFTNAAAGDFTLQAGSPMIDAALSPLFDPVNDFAFTTRPQNGVSDVGAYEA